MTGIAIVVDLKDKLGALFVRLAHKPLEMIAYAKHRNLEAAKIT